MSESLRVGLEIVTVVLSGGALTAFVGWRIAKRQTSGSVNTSEAASLWAESQAMRQELRAEVVASRNEVSSLRIELAEVRSALTAVRAEADHYRQESQALQARISVLERPPRRGATP